ncbi:hypothetical protein TRVL_01290 [Trypanosoma vivax]|nr:hypothetical protein TRVL_01290 [Trypanosoma vivax]
MLRSRTRAAWQDDSSCEGCQKSTRADGKNTGHAQVRATQEAKEGGRDTERESNRRRGKRTKASKKRSGKTQRREEVTEDLHGHSEARNQGIAGNVPLTEVTRTRGHKNTRTGPRACENENLVTGRRTGKGTECG